MTSTDVPMAADVAIFVIVSSIAALKGVVGWLDLFYSPFMSEASHLDADANSGDPRRHMCQIPPASRWESLPRLIEPSEY